MSECRCCIKRVIVEGRNECVLEGKHVEGCKTCRGL